MQYLHFCAASVLLKGHLPVQGVGVWTALGRIKAVLYIFFLIDRECHKLLQHCLHSACVSTLHTPMHSCMDIQGQAGSLPGHMHSCRCMQVYVNIKGQASVSSGQQWLRNDSVHNFQAGQVCVTCYATHTYQVCELSVNGASRNPFHKALQP